MFVLKKRIQLLSRLPLYRAFYTFARGRAPLPVNFTLSLLYSCNSRCATCNVYLKKVDNLTPDEYDRIFATVGQAPFWFTLSGGEPFLRKDIVDIARVIYQQSRPAIINIPTNGSLYRIIPERVEEILRACPGSDVIINLSLDEVGEKHDEIRGFPGNWERAIKTYQELQKLKRYPNLTLGIHTVISVFNVRRFPEIYKELIALQPDSYITEIAEERVELETMGLDITPEAEEYARAIDFLIGDMKNSRLKGLARVARSFRIEYYQLVKQFLQTHQQVIPCYAGVASCQISPDGEVWPCCIRADSMGNLREHDYDFPKIWNGEAASRIRRSIKNRECACPLANASYTNLLLHGRSLTKIAFRLV
ncbi:radical SAM/SPASM domain-containing protein [Caldithrix abyssi]